MATGGQFYWPPAGIFVAAYGQFFMAANKAIAIDVFFAFGEDLEEEIGVVLVPRHSRRVGIAFPPCIDGCAVRRDENRVLVIFVENGR